MDLHRKRYLIVSLHGYPHGGGEDFLLQTMKWATQFDMQVVWLHNGKTFNVGIFDHGIIIQAPGLFSPQSPEALRNWIKIIQPDIVHHQGLKRLEIVEICTELRLPLITGYHFWTGAVELDPSSYNCRIMDHVSKHKKALELDIVMKNKFVTPYVCSDFVQKVIQTITSYEIPNIIYPISGADKKSPATYNADQRQYVTLINIHRLKGGEVLLHLLNNAEKDGVKIPYLGIYTEPGSEQLDEKLKKYGEIISHVKDLKEIYAKTRILIIPSLVDETFCRVAYEGLMNGIPIVSSNHGNLSYLLKDTAIFLPVNKFELWDETIHDLYSNYSLLREMSVHSLMQYKRFSEEHSSNSFKKLIKDSLVASKESNIMVFAPWCDQGLGIQSRNYTLILRKNGFRVFIFSYKPYCIKEGTAELLQKNPIEWQGPEVYYSKNDREHVTDTELVQFINKYNIGKCIIPETCWNRVFEIAQLMKRNQVKCYAIPNIEIVRRDEIHKHRYFYRILCNNKLCLEIFQKHGFKNLSLISYAIDPDTMNIPGDNLFSPESSRVSNETIRFLLLGGMNAFSRKQALDVCKSFDQAYRFSQANKGPSIHLTLTMYEQIDHDVYKYRDHPGIDLIDRQLSYQDINQLYSNTDVSIQVSKHEGLGLGFYESLYYMIPVLTLDARPHNEIINNRNGWIVPCHLKDMVDNNDSFIQSAYFNIDDLAEKILAIANKPQEIVDRCDYMQKQKKFAYQIFVIGLVKALS